MSGGDPVTLRTADAADAPFLQVALVDAAFRPGLVRPPMADVLADPAIGHYVSGWPRTGDHGIVAEAEGGGAPVGAAWFRFFGVDDPGYGFVDDTVPEISIAVREGWRGRGVGRLLLDRLLADAATLRIARLSLSVALDNPGAVHLYRSVGFDQVGAAAGGSITMVAPTRTPADR